MSSVWRVTYVIGLYRSQLLPSGVVLIAGGTLTTCTGCNSSITNRAELYDPQTGTSTLIDSSILPRAEQAAVALRDGTVLLVGSATPFLAAGSSHWSEQVTATAELFVPFPAQIRATMRPR
ncbi:MAG: hypothetical protein ACREK8_00770 [Gemmatimonadales bacterium]